MSDDVFVVITNDRHMDIVVEVWTDQAAAEARAADIVDQCRRGDRPRVDDEDDSLNDAMRADGWTYYARYSVEGDNVSVQRRTLQGPT